MSEITEYLHNCAVQYRTKQQQKFVELALKEFEHAAKRGGVLVTLLPANRAHFYMEYGAEVNSIFQEPWSEGPEWVLIHASAFDTDDLQAAFEAHGFRVEYDEHGRMEVDWMQGGLPDTDGQTEPKEGSHE